MRRYGHKNRLQAVSCKGLTREKDLNSQLEHCRSVRTQAHLDQLVAELSVRHPVPQHSGPPTSLVQMILYFLFQLLQDHKSVKLFV